MNSGQLDELLHAVLQASADHVFLITCEGLVLDVVAAKYCLPDAMDSKIGKHLHECFGADASSVILQAVAQSRATGKSVHADYQGDYGLGLRVLGTQVFAFGGDRAVISIRNTTDELVTREALHREEQKKEALLSAIPDPIFHIRGDGTYIGYNALHSSQLFVPPDAFLGKKIADIFPPEVAEVNMKAIKDALASGHIQTFTYKSPTRDAYFEVRVVPSDENEVVEIVRDITANLELERAAKALRDELEQRVQARTIELTAAIRELESFCYSASHDLRAPLRSINGFSSLIAQDYAHVLDDEGRECLGRIKRATVRMDQIISDMLRLAGVVRSEMRHEVINLSQLATDVARDIESAAQHSTIWHIEAELSAIGDPSLVHTLMENLLANAHKFATNSQTPTVRFGRLRDDFFIQDNGIGFNQSEAQTLFEAFHRLDPVGNYPGEGIGLAISKRIVDRHGGVIWAEGNPGTGATFYFNLGDKQSNRSIET